MFNDILLRIIRKDPFLLEEKIKKTAEYIVMLERIAEENGIAIDDDALSDLKNRHFDEIKEDKRRFLMQFVGEIIREEG
ncbi:MAG: hypothetical protein GXP60_03650 [Epsilonproteobacteria bacterium]|nr:hypothetical protein [Campylobacterota bacterium]